jgi:hypothetical protein
MVYWLHQIFAQPCGDDGSEGINSCGQKEYKTKETLTKSMVAVTTVEKSCKAGERLHIFTHVLIQIGHFKTLLKSRINLILFIQLQSLVRQSSSPVNAQPFILEFVQHESGCTGEGTIYFGQYTVKSDQIIGAESIPKVPDKKGDSDTTVKECQINPALDSSK